MRNWPTQCYLLFDHFVRNPEHTTKMKINVIARSLLVGAALSTGSLFANIVKLADTANDGNLNGGEFLATASLDNSFATTGDNWSFLTFCLEQTINVSMGVTYTYTIDASAFSGGVDTISPGAGDPISAGTAWLYEQFYLGTLVAPNGAGTYFDANRDFNAGVLQKAFWTLEQESTDAGNLYVAMAVTHFGSAAAAFADASPTSKVKVMNLWTSTGGDVQSQLVYVPEGGMSVALLGLGLLSLAAFRRKL